MSSLFNKCIKFLCAVTCAIAFTLPLFALNSAQVQTWAAPWINSGGTATNGAFNLPLWVNGNGSTLQPHLNPIFGGPPSLGFGPGVQIFSLGSRQQQETVNESTVTFIPQDLFFASKSIAPIQPSIYAPTLTPSLYSQFRVIPPAVSSDFDKVYFSDTLHYSDGTPDLTDYSAGEATPVGDWRFYDLSQEGLTGFYLGAIAINGLAESGYFYAGNGHWIASFSGVWTELGGDYADQVFLFGPCPVPEPGTYLMLGTLLAVVAFVARRKTQVA
jgi:hypothetical protein